MSAIAAPLHRLRAPVARFRALPMPLRTAISLAFLTGVSLALRTQAIHARYWIDEGLSIGIASHPLGDIPGLLRQDGSPPFYYLLLSLWVDLFGVGEARTHGLSIAFALVLVPVAFVAGRALFGIRAGWIAALLAAMNPFITYYAEETRMYSLVTLLSVAVTATFVLAFVQRRRAWLPGFAAALTLLIYTHNWGLFLAVGTVAALLVMVATTSDRRPLVRDAALAYGAAGLAYLPWVPSLLFQARHTGAPWSDAPALHNALAAVTSLLGGAAPAMAFALAGGVGIAAMLAAPHLRGGEARAILAVGVMGLTALLLAWGVAQVSPAWATRYLAALMGPLLIIGAGSLNRAGTLGTVVVVVLVVLWANPRVHALETKSNAYAAAVLVRDRVEPGDLVVATHPEQGPLMHLYLPRGLRWANAMGFVPDPRIMDWRDALHRLKEARPRGTADRFVRTLRPGQRIVLVQPIIRTANWGAPWTKLVRRRAAQWERALDRDKRLARTLAAPRLRGKPLPRGVRIVLYERL